MPHRPLGLIVLGVLHILEPIGKLLYYKLVMPDLSSRIFNNLLNLPFIELFTWLALFPIAGIAILAVKNWSLPVFLAVESYVVYSNYSVFKLMYLKGHYLDLSFLLGFSILNILVVTFLLVPAVRIYYVDPKIRWWEAFPRYNVGLDAVLEGFGATKVHDMSKSGVFAEAIDGVNEGDIVPLIFSYDGQEYKLNGKTVAFFQKGPIKGMGIQFFGLDTKDKKMVSRLIKTWEKVGIDRRPAKRNYFKEFIVWFKEFVRTGKVIQAKKYRK